MGRSHDAVMRPAWNLAAMGRSYNASMSLELPAWLGNDPQSPFPPVSRALREPNGLLAAGGDLTPARLLDAYAHGIFPWYSEGQPILWWSPDPRMLFRSDGVHLSSRFRRSLRGSGWRACADTAFEAVIDACAGIPRRGQRGTWITPAMRAAYVELHHLGHAHSVEVFDGDRLVGGIYGVATGRMFFGESMFSIASGGSKVALAALAHRLRQWGWPLIDAQVENDHLQRLGAESWPRRRFIDAIDDLCRQPGVPGPWTGRFGRLPASELAAPRTDG
jgi:leucyl/phenylalanyl-tRNA--protein transferase